MTADRAFEAPDLIEVMDEAVHYNRFLVDQLMQWGGSLGPLLDFGAGNGRFAAALHERSVDVHAIEPDPLLREKIGNRGVRTYESLEAAGEGRFAGVYTLNVLEHLEDDRAILAGFHRCLVPGGGLLVYVPAFELLFSANDARVGHVRRYRLAGLCERIRAAGFAVERARYVDSIGFFAGLAYRLFGDADGDLGVRAVRLYDRVVLPISLLLDSVLGRVLGKNLLVTAIKRPTD
ncbi:MAG: class I SAM-dependent methyltransferase [Myxococcota bacterium]